VVGVPALLHRRDRTRGSGSSITLAQLRGLTPSERASTLVRDRQAARPTAPHESLTALLGSWYQIRVGLLAHDEVLRSSIEAHDGCSTTASTCATLPGDLIEAVLAHSATVKVLATSREGLGVANGPFVDLAAHPDCDIANGALRRAIVGRKTLLGG